ncbi:hypothetical protein CEUSTIGMA_g2116.t1 [Chlamydomonas eustigma]|uniref:MICOS complex subunit MIC10 n=1 Tax=Chlamydomonas eustigma TaxID=1157962 RepID=A0A250WV17_9CHLO|nr:hypothetical protein CEUSTIGMA_g2116.t1 [Chlamydomonas eustigma]|eukprot:GAX74668.1 hypothetical protein CEUSTIGMA_g2116.t1 [Chlamydomonas eustigma]
MSDKASLHLDERWDKLFELSFRRAIYGTLAGGAAAALLFRGPYGRTAALAFGAGAGLGSAWQVCSNEFEDLVPSLLRKS